MACREIVETDHNLCGQRIGQRVKMAFGLDKLKNPPTPPTAK